MSDRRRLADLARVEPWLHSPLGPAMTSRWTEPLLLHAVTRWYFPLSRLWAMAEVDDPALHELRPRTMTPGKLDRAIAAVADARRDAAEAARRWEDALFSSGCRDAEALRQREAERRAAAHRFNLTRRYFLPLRTRLASSIDWAIVPEADVTARWQAALANPQIAYRGLPPANPPQQSASIAGPYGEESWLRFPSPWLNDTVLAHVYTPAKATDPPTLIYGHGVGVETEQWDGAIEEAAGLARLGVRVVRAEAPWHGRRRPPGSFGGEPMFARGPDGSLDMMAAQSSEIAGMVAWARATSGGPVAIGGMSLGALCAQLVVDHAKSWPTALRPDAAILCGTCDRLDAVLQQGTLPLAIGLPQALALNGWTVQGLERWRPLLEPRGEPAVDPANLVMLVGRFDRVMPYAHACAMAARWRVPPENLFARAQGHFGLALGLVRDPAPMHRLAEILRRLAG